MKMVSFEVKVLAVHPQCECGCILDERASDKQFILTSPAQLRFTCPQCGKVSVLSEPEWPHLVYEKIPESIPF